MNRPLMIIKQSAIDNIKSNPNVFWDGVKANPIVSDNAFAFLKDEYQDESHLAFDFEFSTTGYKKREDSDFDNTVRLYKALHAIPRNVLFSEAFLFSFLFTYGYEYFHWRWIPVYKDEASRAVSHILFTTNSRRAITVNAIGHLLFRAFMLVDETQTGPAKYALLKNAYRYRNCFTIDYYSYADNRKVYRSFVKTIIKLAEEGTILSNNKVKALCSHLSMLQSVSACETLEESEIVDLLCEYAKKTLLPANQ